MVWIIPGFLLGVAVGYFARMYQTGFKTLAATTVEPILDVPPYDCTSKIKGKVQLQIGDPWPPFACGWVYSDPSTTVPAAPPSFAKIGAVDDSHPYRFSVESGGAGWPTSGDYLAVVWVPSEWKLKSAVGSCNGSPPSSSSSSSSGTSSSSSEMPSSSSSASASSSSSSSVSSS